MVVMKSILFLCHGNICRSLMAEFVMKKLLADAGRNDIKVESAALTIDIIDEQLKKIQDYIDNYDKNWSLYNNCTDYVMDVFDATGKSSEINTSSWRTNGWLDPRKGYTWMLQNGGKIKE